ncbi:MAG: hypothetical protein ACJAX5_000320, partial [Patiriisocius sp.]
TLAELFNVESDHITHGKSLLPLIYGEKTSVREYALGGIFGQWVQIQDGKNKYARAPVGDGFPLSMWSNRWSTMPVPSMPGLRLPNPDHRAYLDFMPGSDVPVIRQPFQQGDMLPFWAMAPQVDDHHLYSIFNDPGETQNRIGDPDEKRMLELLHTALTELQAPAEQFERLGLG